MFFGHFRRFGLVWASVFWLMLPGLPPAALAASKAPEGSRIEGKVRGGDGKTPVAGAVVHAFPLDGDGTYSSDPTGHKGSYRIAGLPFGYYDVVVETDAGTFVASQVLMVPPSGRVTLVLDLQRYDDLPETWWRTHGRRQPPQGTPGEVAGIAAASADQAGDFWKSPKGIAVLVGGGAAILLLVASSDETAQEVPASPSTP